MFETIEEFYKYLINKSSIVVNNLVYNTYFEIFFDIKEPRNIHKVFDEAFSRKFEDLNELYVVKDKNVSNMKSMNYEIIFPVKYSKDENFLKFYELINNKDMSLVFYNTSELSNYSTNIVRSIFTEKTNYIKNIVEANREIIVNYANIYYDFKVNYDKLNKENIEKEKELKQKKTELNNLDMNSNDMILFDKLKHIEYSTISSYNNINNLYYIANNSYIKLIKEINIDNEIDIKEKLDYFYIFDKFYNLLDLNMTVASNINLDIFFNNNILLNNIIIVSYLFVINFILNYPKLFFTILESLHNYHERLKTASKDIQSAPINSYKFKALYNFFKYIIYNKLYVSKFFDIDVGEELKIEIINDASEPFFIYANDIYNKNNIERLTKLKSYLIEKIKEPENKGDYKNIKYNKILFNRNTYK